MKVYSSRLQKETKVKTYYAFLFACFFSSALLCKAQISQVDQEELEKFYPKRLVTGVALLVGPSFIYGRSTNFLDGKPGFSAGLGVSHDFNSKFSLSANFLYEIKGYKQELSGVNMDSGYARPTNSIFNLTLNYLSVSPLAIYHVPNTHISLGCGPYFAYLINSKFRQDTYVNGSLASIYRRRLLSNELYKSYDLGFTATISYSIALERRLVAINLSYNLGLLEINQPMVSSLKNNSIVLIFAYQVKRHSSRL